MDSPSNPIDLRNQIPETVSPILSLIHQSNVESHSITEEIRVTESVSEDMAKSIEEDDDETMDPADSQATSSSFYCHGGGPKRKKGNNKKRKLLEEKSKEKLKVLVETLKPVPFNPCKKTLDFSRYESLLKTLGLWEFVHLEFDQCIEFDLVAQLIASYSHEGRCSYVNGSRIKLSRADLARALKLPTKKERVVILDEDKELLESDVSVKFLDDIVSDWILLHCDDAWMMPDEVVEWRKGLKEKQLDKLDWAGLFWIMVEKELKAEPPLGDCYYASHMQMVIRSQKKDLLSEETEVGGNEVKVEDSVIKSLEEDTPREQSRVEDIEVKEVGLKVNDDIAAVNLRMDDGASGSKEEDCVEECMIELNLGPEIVSEVAAEEERHHEEQPMDLEENKEAEDEKWLWNEDNHAYSNFLQGCGVGDATAGDERNKTEGHREVGENEAREVVAEEEIEEDEEKHEGGFSLFPNGETQENLMLDDTSPLGYNSELQNYGNSSGDFLASRSGNGMHMVQTSSVFGNGKREIDHENDMSYHYGNPATKRLRIDDGPSYDDKPVPFEVCMEQIKHLVDTAKLSYLEKDRACEESNMRQQMLVNELQRREGIIQQLQKEAYEEQQRKDREIYKLENELRMTTSVFTGYRKALKETKKEYRKHFKRCTLRDQPLYKDVKGSGGLVLSTAEIEKLRLKQEEEEGLRRAQIESQVEESASQWMKECEVNVNIRLELLEEKLTGFQNQVKLLQEKRVSRREVLDTPEKFDATAET